MKQIIIIAVAVLLTAPCMAQKKSSSKTEGTWQMEAGPVIAIPFQFLHLFNSFGIGVNVAALKPVDEHISAGARVSYTYFFGKKAEGLPGISRYSATNIANVLGELNYRFDNNIVAGGDLGVGFAIKSGGTNTQIAENLYVGYKLIEMSHPMMVSLVVNTTHTQKSVGVRGNFYF